VDDTRLDVIQCIITGPEDTPYANGCFLFDVFCPAQYPSVSPLFNLMTTGKGSVRFNPNLYNCGKVCLSLLGTWRGGPNEQWNEKTSTLLQVFVSIQSLILVTQPYFNEPGYESNMNTAEGTKQSVQYNEVIRVATLQWAIIDQLKHPSPGFEEAIKIHFRLKRDDIMKHCQKWIAEGKNNKTHADQLRKLTKEAHELLQALDPSAPLLVPEDEEEKREKQEKQEKEMERWIAAVSLRDFVPNYPLALCVKALEASKDSPDQAVNWLLEKGESHLFDHPELWDVQSPFDDPTTSKKDQKKEKEKQ